MMDSTFRDTRAVLVRSNELMDEQRDGENVELIEKGMDRFPDDPHLRLRAAALALVAQQPAKAKEHSCEAVELAPDDPGVLTHAASHMEAMHEHEQRTDCSA
jgi:hypothetical protein